MQPFVKVRGAAVPFLEANIDTDVIIRIERLTERADLAHYALEAVRYLPDGSPNPQCVLNEPRYVGAPILLAGENFGCGSSREGAVTALMAMGFRAVIAPSFGDIFAGNCVRNGMLPIVLPMEAINAFAAQSASGDFAIDLQAQSIQTPSGETAAFPVDPLQRLSLLEGLDELGLTLTLNPEVLAWQAQHRLDFPWIWATRSGS